VKRITFYRRGGSTGGNSGLKEKMVWQLSKRPMTGRELAAIFKMELPKFNKLVRQCIVDTGTVCISASEWVKGEDGLNDRTYTLERLGQRAFPKPGQSIIVSKNSYGNRNPESREQHRKAARERARLIASGQYRNHMG